MVGLPYGLTFSDGASFQTIATQVHQENLCNCLADRKEHQEFASGISGRSVLKQRLLMPIQ
jgi:hypothetical protein